MTHVWEKSYPQGVTWDAPLGRQPRRSKICSRRRRAKGPEATAIELYGRVFTYRELHQLAAQAAKGLQLLGVGPGVHVGLHLPNSPHFVICFFAALMAGGRIVNFSPLAAPRELKRQLERRREVKVMVTMEPGDALPADCRLEGDGKVRHARRLPSGGFLPGPLPPVLLARRRPAYLAPAQEVEFAELIANDGGVRRYPHGPLEDEVAVLQYTGGTTGEPKGAMLTHANFCTVINVLRIWGGRAMGASEPTRPWLCCRCIISLGLSCI